MKNENVKKIGLWGAVALVFSGMVGSGILIIPSEMGSMKSWGFFSWILGACMTYCMFLSFARVNNYYLAHSDNDNPDILDFLRLKFCENTSFLISFGHFAASNVSAAVTAMSLGYYFLGVVAASGFPLCAKSIATIALIMMFFINVVSFGLANVLNFWLTLAKLIFFLLIAIWGSVYYPSYVSEFGSPVLLFTGAGITMFAFAGIEYGVFSSGSIENPQENVIKATKYGLIFASLIFIGVYTATLLVLPDLSATKTPVYDCAVILMGPIGAKIIGVVAVLSCLTTLNGILVVQGNSCRNFAKKGCLPKCLDNQTAQGFPYRGALISLIISLLLIWSPYPVQPIYTVAFIGILYSAVVLLDILLNGVSFSSILGVISCAIMLCNINFSIIMVLATVYLFGFLLKYFNNKGNQK